ncbi:uncharacterized protein F4822DRAFT_395892 [Hypoxylon trugodes]|uniref:uncharacterized protein n=1 Tax=Hypoxylon trugodes TaxID=326681 RepID=UPI00219D5577|nr:uncharacterized protein F4822DRAFT_395892 [Hypoxylon trugodes]KAI1391191.1 hypothetical protein F4822DRAFT_395892 [Hypoxylon trugodes]
MNDSNMQDHRPRGPRLYHKKSRTGCLRCKQRRVKCDELRPSCGSCSRHAVECVYSNSGQIPAGKVAQATQQTLSPSGSMLVPPTDDGSHSGSIPGRLGSISAESKSAYSPQSSAFYPSPSSSQPTPDDGADGDISMPEGPWRRHWELRLIHNYHQNMAQPFPVPQNPEIVALWIHEIPNLAMRMAQQHNRCTLLNVMLANSALYMYTQSTDKQERAELSKLQSTYQYMFSREQRRDIDELTQDMTQHGDYVCFTAIRILAHSIALVQTLTVDPWEPPVQWLYMGRGAGEILGMARKLVQPGGGRKIAMFARSPPDMSDPDQLIYHDHSALDWLLEHPAGAGSIAEQEDRELDEENVKSVYDKALSFTCSVQEAIDNGEPDYAIVRRFGGFAIWVPIEFTRFVEERRPRAMVVLAHFMALWLNYDHVWMIGRAGEMQIRGIYKVLPLEWSYKLDGLFARFKQPEAGK